MKSDSARADARSVHTPAMRRPRCRGLAGVAVLAFAAVLLSACGSAPKRGEGSAAAEPPAASAAKPAGRGGGYYKDDGPDEVPPDNLDAIPDAEPRLEPLHRFANRPYNVFGKGYVPATELRPHRERGRASWYGRRFHGKPTSSGEPYDMYAMTAAHPTLPIPSYVRVTHVASGRSVVVRINDRGPFHKGRIIDLSYTAAHKLGYINAGSAEVEVEQILPDELPLLEAEKLAQFACGEAGAAGTRPPGPGHRSRSGADDGSGRSGGRCAAHPAPAGAAARGGRHCGRCHRAERRRACGGCGSRRCSGRDCCSRCDGSWRRPGAAHRLGQCRHLPAARRLHFARERRRLQGFGCG